MLDQMRQPKAVVVRVMNGGIPIHRSIHRFTEDMYIPPFREFVQKIYPNSDTHLINVRDPSEPDPNKVAQRGELWCPYCSEYRSFVKDGFVGTERCEICGISTNDWHIKTINKLWPSIRQVAEEAAKRKKGGGK